MAGCVTEFVKVGDTARRPPNESSASVQQLTTHFEQAGFDEGAQAVAAGQVRRLGDIAPRNTVFAYRRPKAFIDGVGIFVSTQVWDLAHAVWQFTPVCDDVDRWLAAPDRPVGTQIAAAAAEAELATLRFGIGPRIVSNSDGVISGDDCSSHSKRSLSLLTMKSAPFSHASTTR